MKSEKKEKKNRKVAPPDPLPLYHLLPFVLFVVISFIWFLPYKPALATMSVQRMVLKCLPILYLAIYLIIADRGRGESGRVFFALIFSAIGDGFLAFHDICFLYGVAAFGVAHCIYAKTFGFQPVKLLTGGFLFALNFCILSYFALPYIQPVSFRVCMTIYSLVLVTMAWRSVDRYLFMTTPCKERRLCSALGGIIFIISDSSYVFLQMLELLPHIPAQIIILTTYYLSQLCFMLGSCESFWGPARNYPKKRS